MKIEYNWFLNNFTTVNFYFVRPHPLPASLLMTQSYVSMPTPIQLTNRGTVNVHKSTHGNNDPYSIKDTARNQRKYKKTNSHG